jgi:hypothetical protein
MNFNEYFANMIFPLYNDYHCKEKHLQLDHAYGKITDTVYDIQTKLIKWELRGGMMTLWEDLSEEDQIKFYIASSCQNVFVPYLTDEQRSSVIILQGSLMRYRDDLDD